MGRSPYSIGKRSLVVIAEGRSSIQSVPSCAVPCALSSPCRASERDGPFLRLACLREGNTCGFLHPPCTSHRSMRLFLERFLAADNEPLPNDQTGISIGIAAHLTLLTEAKRCARGIAYDGLPLGIANDQAMAASACSGRIAGVHPAGNHP